VALEPYPGGIELTVNDDGRGLPQHVPDDTIGIEGMRERALLAGGSLAIESQPGQGTLVTLRVPAGEVP
jgi:two-component system, NarL family, sensor histidine kinase UhpB